MNVGIQFFGSPARLDTFWIVNSWLNEREMMLRGNDTCSGEGDERIMVVMEKLYRPGYSGDSFV